MSVKLELQYFSEPMIKALYRCNIITKQELNDEMDRRMAQAIEDVNKLLDRVLA